MSGKEDLPRPQYSAAEKHARSIVVLGIQNPDTNKPHTDDEIIKLFGFEPGRWHEIRAGIFAPSQQKTSLNPIPTPRLDNVGVTDWANPEQDQPPANKSSNNGNGAHSPIPDSPGRAAAEKKAREVSAQRANEQLATKDRLHPATRMLFTGVSIGEGYNIAMGEGNSKKIYVRSKTAPDRLPRRFLKEILSQHGTLSSDSQELTVFFPYEKYSFMLNPITSGDLWGREVRFAPFLLGFMGSSVTASGRMSHADTEFLKKLQNYYVYHYQQDLGKMRADGGKGSRHFISISNIEGVLTNLVRTSKNAGLQNAEDIKALILSTQLQKADS